METGEKKLILKTENIRNIFEEIFLPTGKLGYVFQAPFTVTLVLGIGILILDLLLLHLTTFSNATWIFLIMSLILSFFLWHSLIKLFRERLSGLKQITSYLDNVAQYKTAEIKLTAASFQLSLNNQVYIDRWSQIRFASIKDDYIYFTGNDNYYIPRKCLIPIDYETLRNVLRQKMYREEENTDDYKEKSE